MRRIGSLLILDIFLTSDRLCVCHGPLDAQITWYEVIQSPGPGLDPDLSFPATAPARLQVLTILVLFSGTLDGVASLQDGAR